MRRIISSILLLTCLAAPLPALAAIVPIAGYYDRQTVKGFGTLADDAFHERHRDLFPNNGFQNQFTGLHAAVDVEFTSPADAQRDVPVRAAADGTVIYVGDVAGYGGLVVIRHTDPESVTTVYGHVRLSDVSVREGDRVREGQRLAVLGAPFSAETSGARKHLHFGVHQGPDLDLAGHEQTREQLAAEWYNPNDWLRRHGATPEPSPTASPALAASPEPAAQHQQTWFDKIIDWLKDLFT